MKNTFRTEHLNCKEIDEIEEILGNSNIVIAELKRDIVSELNKQQTYLDELRLLFQQILENAIYLDEEFDNSYFNITLNSTSPRNQLPFKISLEIPKADALGQERLKIVAYDLMVFLKAGLINAISLIFLYTMVYFTPYHTKQYPMS